MLLSIIQWIIISLVFIILLHYLYSFFINTLTVPKVKDLVNKPLERYNDILKNIPNEMTNTNTNTNINTNTYRHTQDMKNNQNDYNVNINEQQNMIENELRDFLSELKKEN